MKRAPYRVKVPEASIQETCCAWLLLDGWRRIRTDMKQLRGMGVQEKGMADDLFIRYKRNETKITDLYLPWAELLWVEWKSKRGIHGQKQDEWQLLERTRGALIWVAKKDFEPTIEGFQDHYADSGLLRNKGLRPRRKEAKWQPIER